MTTGNLFGDIPFDNPYMTDSHEVAGSQRNRQRKDFTLTEAGEEMYMMYPSKSDGLPPVMLMEGTPFERDGKIAGISPMMVANPNVPLDAIFEQDPERFVDGMKSLFRPTNIYSIKTVNFVGPTVKVQKNNGQEVQLPGLSFIDDFPPSVKAKGNPGLTAFDMIWANAERVAKLNPAWQGFLPSRSEDGTFRSNYLPNPSVSYFCRAALFNWHGMAQEDKWNNPDHAVVPLRQTAYRSLINLALTINPQWDRSRVRTHADLYDPNNRPFLYDLVNAYGNSPLIVMRYKKGGKGGSGQSLYSKRKHGDQKGEFSPAGYSFSVYTQEVGPEAGKPVFTAPAQNVLEYIQSQYLPPDKLFNYMEPVEVLRTLLDQSLEVQWSLFLQRCLEGSEVYAALEELFQHTESIVANNVSKYRGVPSTRSGPSRETQQIYQPNQHQQQFAQPPAPQYGQRPGFPPQQAQPQYGQQPGFPQQPAPQYGQQISNVQTPPDQSPLLPPGYQAPGNQGYGQPAPQPPYMGQQTQMPPANPGGVFAPGYGQQQMDPASTMIPGVDPAAIEAQLRGNAPEGVASPSAPQMGDPFAGAQQPAWGAQQAAFTGDDIPF